MAGEASVFDVREGKSIELYRILVGGTGVKATQRDIRRMLTKFALIFNEEVTELLVNAYAETLDLHAEDLDIVYKRAAQTIKWFPKVAELQEIQREIYAEKLRQADKIKPFRPKPEEKPDRLAITPEPKLTEAEREARRAQTAQILASLKKSYPRAWGGNAPAYPVQRSPYATEKFMSLNDFLAMVDAHATFCDTFAKDLIKKRNELQAKFKVDSLKSSEILNKFIEFYTKGSGIDDERDDWMESFKVFFSSMV